MTEEMQALKRLDDQARLLERTAIRPVARGLYRRGARAAHHRLMAARCSAGRRISTDERDRAEAQPDEDRHLQHQQRQPPPAQSAGLAENGQARHRLPAGTQVHGRAVSGRRDQARPDITPSGAGSGPGTASPSLRAVPSRSSRALALPGDPKDDQARYIEAAIGGILVGCIYLPNGNPQPGPKFDYKLAWFKRLHGARSEAA